MSSPLVSNTAIMLLLEAWDFVLCISQILLYSGARMFYNTQEMMLRRKLEQEAELQQAIELQGRRLMNMQLMDLKNHHHNHHFQPSMMAGIASPTMGQSQANQSHILPCDGINIEVPEG